MSKPTKKRRRKKREMIRHLWSVTVRHRQPPEYPQKISPYWTATTLFVVVPRPFGYLDQIEDGLAAARRVLRRTRRQYPDGRIRAVEYQGSVDN
jgi:hypothetical protein